MGICCLSVDHSCGCEHSCVLKAGVHHCFPHAPVLNAHANTLSAPLPEVSEAVTLHHRSGLFMRAPQIRLGQCQAHSLTVPGDVGG